MKDKKFRKLVDIYKQFYHDEISRSEAESRIGDNWEEVSQIATMELCREEQDKPGISELQEAFGHHVSE